MEDSIIHRRRVTTINQFYRIFKFKVEKLLSLEIFTLAYSRLLNGWPTGNANAASIRHDIGDWRECHLD